MKLEKVKINYEVREDGAIGVEIIGEYGHALAGIGYLLYKMSESSNTPIEELMEQVKLGVKAAQGNKETEKK